MDTKKWFWLGWKQPIDASWPTLSRLPGDFLGVWRSGETSALALMVGMVLAPCEDDAKRTVKEHFDVTGWRFCEVKPFGESLGDRFELTKGMKARFKAAEAEHKAFENLWESGFRRIAEAVSPRASWSIDDIVKEVQLLKKVNGQLKTAALDELLTGAESEPSGRKLPPLAAEYEALKQQWPGGEAEAIKHLEESGISREPLTPGVFAWATTSCADLDVADLSAIRFLHIERGWSEQLIRE